MTTETELREAIERFAQRVDLREGNLAEVVSDGRRRRTRKRAGQVAGAALLVAGLVTGGVTALTDPLRVDIGETPPTDPALPTAPAAPLPFGWQVIEIGDASFAMPEVWPTEQVAAGTHVCRNTAEVPTTYIAPDGVDPTGPCLSIQRSIPTLVAMPLSEVSEGWPRAGAPPPDGRARRVHVNGHLGLVLDGTAEFPDLDLYLQYLDPSADPVPRLGPSFDLIVQTVATTDQPRDRAQGDPGASTWSGKVDALLAYEPPAAYRMDVAVASMMHLTVQMTVMGGEATSVEYLDPGTGRTLGAATVSDRDVAPTIAHLQAQVRNTLWRGGRVTALIVSADGRPVHVGLDPLPNAIDDEVSYRIERFEELPLRPPLDR